MQLPKKLEKRIGELRIERLFELGVERASKNTPEDTTLSKRYIGLALRISRHYKIKLPENVRRGICGKCHSALIPGKNCSVRVLDRGVVAYKCVLCGSTKKIFAST